MYGSEFIKELADLLRELGVRTIIECGCGGGHVLHGLAERGFTGVGIDADEEMIDIATARHSHPAIEFRKLDWRKARELARTFDAVICRGNSLTNVGGWGKGDIFDPGRCRMEIGRSLKEMLAALKSGGLLYLDTISQHEIDQGGGHLNLSFLGYSMAVDITHDWFRRTRVIEGKGIVRGQQFQNRSLSYLLAPNEMEGLVRGLGVKRVLRPNLAAEPNYDIICAVK